MTPRAEPGDDARRGLAVPGTAAAADARTGGEAPSGGLPKPAYMALNGAFKALNGAFRER